MIQQMKFCVCQRNSTKLGKPSKQAEKLKSRKMKDESRMMKKDEGWWFLAVDGFWFMTDEQTDICECRVAFTTENKRFYYSYDCRDLYSYIEWWTIL